MEERHDGFVDANKLASLRMFILGELITISLVGMEVGGEKMAPNQLITGSISSPGNGFIKVDSARYMPEIVGEEIGLATDSITYKEGVLQNRVTLQNGVIGGGHGFAYYFSNNVWEARGRLIARPEHIVHTPLIYGRLIVGETVVIGEGFTPNPDLDL